METSRRASPTRPSVLRKKWGLWAGAEEVCICACVRVCGWVGSDGGRILGQGLNAALLI